jgi:hypothetical protein
MFQFIATLSFMPLFVATFRRLNSVRYNGVIYSFLTCTVIIRTHVQNFPPKISRDVGILLISRVFCSMLHVFCIHYVEFFFYACRDCNALHQMSMRLPASELTILGCNLHYYSLAPMQMYFDCSVSFFISLKFEGLLMISISFFESSRRHSYTLFYVTVGM